MDPVDVEDWDATVRALPASTFFHGTAWARVLHGSYGYTPVYFVADSPGHALSVLPMMEVNSRLTGRRGVGLPFTDECEPLCTDGAVLRGLFEELLEHGHLRGWKYVECRGGRKFLPGAVASTSFYAHELPLRGGEQSLFANVDQSVRRAVRKAEKSGVTIEFCHDEDAIRIFYDLVCKTRKRQGVPPQPFRFYQNIRRHILSQNLGFVVLARYQQVPVAGAVYFHWGKRGLYKYGASDEAYQQVRANNLVMWEAIKWYAQNGFEQLHFGRTSLINEGLRRFKLSWNTEESMIEYVRYDWRKSGFVTAKDEASGWHNRVFQRLPASLSRVVGSLLYKHVA